MIHDEPVCLLCTTCSSDTRHQVMRLFSSSAAVATFSLVRPAAGFLHATFFNSPKTEQCRSPLHSNSRKTATVATAAAANTPGAEAQVALTREAGKNVKLAALLGEAGIPCVEVPCIAHEDGADLPLLPAALRESDLAYVVVTSPEAAKVFLAGWKEAGEPSLSVACVGKATGESLEKGGVTPVFTPSKATGETLATEIPLPSDGGATGAEAPRRVLYPASAKAQRTLESGLEARGFDVRRLNTYDTVPAEWDAEAEAAAAAVSVAAFGSPSAVKTWAARLGVASGEEREGDSKGPRGALAACIGETSARACREAGWPEVAIFYPEKPGMEGWAQAVGDALASVKTSSEAEAVVQ